MIVLAVYSKDIECLKDNFVSTYEDDIPLYVEEIDVIEGECIYGNEVYSNAIELKCQTVLSYIRKFKGETLIFCDIDIEFYRPFRSLVESKFLENPELDMVFMREKRSNSLSNMGFIAMKCNEKVENLWDNATKNLEVGTYDEGGNFKVGYETSYIHENIESFDIKHDLFPIEIFANSLDGDIPEGIILAHANDFYPKPFPEATWGETKLHRMKQIREEYKKLYGKDIRE